MESISKRQQITSQSELIVTLALIGLVKSYDVTFLFRRLNGDFGRFESRRDVSGKMNYDFNDYNDYDAVRNELHPPPP